MGTLNFSSLVAEFFVNSALDVFSRTLVSFFIVFAFLDGSQFAGDVVIAFIHSGETVWTCQIGFRTGLVGQVGEAQR
jgi:hypothetical protein